VIGRVVLNKEANQLNYCFEFYKEGNIRTYFELSVYTLLAEWTGLELVNTGMIGRVVLDKEAN